IWRSRILVRYRKLGRGFSIETRYLRCVSSPDKSRVWRTRY
ncbi:unnamed protein product, partial [Musa hybrid cultivar]